ELTLLDEAFDNRTSEFREVVEIDPQTWIMSGLRAVFVENEVILQAPPGYAYQKPSGARSGIFLKPDLALTSSANVSFVAFALFARIFSGRNHAFKDIRTVFVDTMAISPVAYALREFLNLCCF